MLMLWIAAQALATEMPAEAYVVAEDFVAPAWILAPAEEEEEDGYQAYRQAAAGMEDVVFEISQSPETTKLLAWMEAAAESGGDGDALRSDLSLFLERQTVALGACVYENDRTVVKLSCDVIYVLED
jgi:hypothetical protein